MESSIPRNYENYTRGLTEADVQKHLRSSMGYHVRKEKNVISVFLCNKLIGAFEELQGKLEIAVETLA